MKLKQIMPLLVMVAAFLFAGEVTGQTNANFNNLTVRNRTRLMGTTYIDTTLYLRGLKPHIVAMNTQWVLLLDSATENVYKIRLSALADSVPIPVQYWTFVDDATDTLYNNVADGDGPGVVQIRGNLELETTKADQTEGIVKQNGIVLLHTYHEKGNNNLFLGQGAGNFTMDSSYNIGFGKDVLNNLTTGTSLIAIGYNAGNDATSAKNGVFIGVNAGAAITDKSSNTFIGSNAGMANTNEYNTVLGANALDQNTAGYNTAIGALSIGGIGTGLANTALGYGTIAANTNGDDGVAVGYSALGTNTDGDRNMAVGTYALASNVGNHRSTAVGYYAMGFADNRSVSTRITYNTAVGYETMRGSATAANNTGQYNTAMGYQALDAMTTATFNTVYGYDAGGGLTTGDSNILIGGGAGSALTTESQLIYIGDLIWGSMLRDSLRLIGDVAITGDLWYEDTFWDDMTTSAESAKLGSNSKPIFDYDSLANRWDNADTTTNYLVFNYQLKHAYSAGTDLYPHVHYIQSSGADTVEWFIILYKWTDLGEARPANFTRIHSNNQTVFPYSSGSIHQLAAFPYIEGTGHTESSILEILLYCWSDGELLTKEFDIHFQINKPGSDNEYP